MDLFTISAFPSDQAMTMIFLASLIVLIPIVMAALGTLSIPLNAFEASRLVSLCK